MSVVINGTTGISGVDGSAGTPAVQGTDNNTGEFFPAADTIAWATGGTERMRVDSSGNLNLNVTGKSYRCTVVQDGASNANNALTGAGYILGRTSSFDASGEAFALRIKGASNGISGEQYVAQAYGSGVNAFEIYTGGSVPLVFGTNATERARILSNGNFLFGTTTSNGSGFTWDNGDQFVMINQVTATTTSIYFRYQGNTRGTISHTQTTTAYNTSSDYRLKENVAPMTGALDKVSQLKPVTYTWKADGSAGQGFIAHELQTVVPECVTGKKDEIDTDGNPIYQGVDTSFLVATLTAAIQELSVKLDEANARIAALEAK